MTGIEMIVTKEFLGLSTGWIARRLVISDRRLRRMEAGEEHIPQAVITLLDDVYEETKSLVDRMSADYRRRVKASDGDVVILYTYRTDEEFLAEGGYYPAKWHRLLCARVAAAVPGLVLCGTRTSTPGPPQSV